ncbi:hypothetical protein ACUSIJ_25065 [Pseudochelatococcus sp. B33]
MSSAAIYEELWADQDVPGAIAIRVSIAVPWINEKRFFTPLSSSHGPIGVAEFKFVANIKGESVFELVGLHQRVPEGEPTAPLLSLYEIDREEKCRHERSRS